MMDRLDQWADPLRVGLRKPRDPLTAVGLAGCSKSLLLASLVDKPVASALIVSQNSDQAAILFEDLAFFSVHNGVHRDRIVLFPSWDIPPYEWSSPIPDVAGQRMAVLARLLRGEPLWIVSSMDAVLRKVLPRSILSGAVLDLVRGESQEPHRLAEELRALGYEPAPQVRRTGEYSLRGGILDVFPGSSEQPARIEFFGDTVESIRLFDPDSQTSVKPTESIRILPVREILLRGDARPEVESILRRTALAAGMDEESADGEVSRLLGSPLPLGVERIAPLVHGPLATFFDYLSPDAWIVLDEAAASRRAVTAHEEQVEDAYAESRGEGGIVSSPEALFIDGGGFDRILSGRSTLLLESLAGRPSGKSSLEFDIRTAGSLGVGLQHGPFQSTLETLNALRGKGRVFIVGHGSESVARLEKIFGEHDCPAASPVNPRLSEFDRTGGPTPLVLLDGALSCGAYISGLDWFFVTEEELFGKARRARPPRRSHASVFLSSFENLRPGDYLVHLQHGIGRYGGLKRLDIAGRATETLVLEYEDRAMLYVPLDRLHEVQKYVGADGEPPILDKLGGNTWSRTKKRAKRDIELMMRELLELYADREVVSGHSFSSDGPLAAEFDAGFEFEETPDQIRVIDEVKADMEQSRPMDRLVCGDVGYGKTEVALRAAFKAVADCRQVAVLAPTTLLADQHHRTFSRRFAPFPVRVEMISRFRTPREQKVILLDAREGKIDILIGTHRLLQRDIEMPNLGLLIVDEEQRFGVLHKERLKRLKKSVDVLTLTATPIPRTLQMALMNIRDLSIIETPPLDRLAVRTTVAEFDRRLTRDAILHELARGGQVFFVNNRVQGIEKMARILREIVPEARIGTAHGQMAERALEDVMLSFIGKELDVLLSTAIIESGLDIPSANTIIITKADHFGLAELYQLRGRVGRSGVQAYAILLVSNLAALTDPAKDRLRAIREFTELGSGFRIAARDLEIRGAGTLLGKKQSGQIASVGFELYMQMIDEAVREHRGERIESEVEPSLNLGVGAGIPETYVPEADQRLALYKRLSAVRDSDSIDRIAAEVRDRYGPHPEDVERLFDVISIRVLAKKAGLSRIDLDESGASLHLDSRHRVNVEVLDRIVREGRYKGPDQDERRVRFLSEFAFKIPIGPGRWKERIRELEKLLQGLN